MKPHLKPATALIIKTWEVHVPICHIQQLLKSNVTNQKDYHIKQSSNVKLYGAERGNRKPAAIFGVNGNVQLWLKHKAVFSDCEVHERNSLHLLKDDFLKLMMHFSRFFKSDRRLE
jgi:hypothetical protein